MRGVALALASAMALAPAAASGESARTVVQRGRAFHPDKITVVRGQMLSINNDDEFIHQLYVTSDSIVFDSGEQPPGQIVTLTFPVAGTFEVRCHIHPRMSLIVHVK